MGGHWSVIEQQGDQRKESHTEAPYPKNCTENVPVSKAILSAAVDVAKGRLLYPEARDQNVHLGGTKEEEVETATASQMQNSKIEERPGSCEDETAAGKRCTTPTWNSNG